MRASEVIRSEEAEAVFSVKNFFTPEDWEQIRESVFRNSRSFNALQDRYFLSQVSDDPADQFQTVEQEELFGVGQFVVKEEVSNIGKKNEVPAVGWARALHFAAFVAQSFPNKRAELSVASQIQNFFHEIPNALFSVDPGQEKPVGLRVMLREIRQYLNVFPTDRAWVVTKLTEKKIYEQVLVALEQLATVSNWHEYLLLSSEVRLLFPEFTPSHLPELIAHVKQQLHSNPHILYTFLPEVLKLRILAAERAEIGNDGLIHIQDRSPKMEAPAPLPDRLIT